MPLRAQAAVNSDTGGCRGLRSHIAGIPTGMARVRLTWPGINAALAPAAGPANIVLAARVGGSASQAHHLNVSSVALHKSSKSAWLRALAVPCGLMGVATYLGKWVNNCNPPTVIFQGEIEPIIFSRPTAATCDPP